MKKLFVFGGTYAVPQFGHLFIATWLLLDADSSVMIVPTGIRTDKKEVVSAHHRLEMVKLLFGSLQERVEPGRLIINDVDVFKTNVPTYRRWIQIESEYPERQVIWCIGSDLVNDLRHWEHGEELTKKVMCVFPRPGSEEVSLPPQFIKADMPLVDASSSDIIARLRRDDPSWKSYTLPRVVQYIETHNYLGLKNTNLHTEN